MRREENPELQLLSELENNKKKKEEKTEIKQPKNVYFGIKARKGFSKTGYGDRQTMELFYYLPEYSNPNPYLQHVYWYHMRKKQLMTVGQIEKDHMRLLHGPYQKFINGKLVEEGYFFQGAKHGRWEFYDGNYTLLDKLKYYKGWLKESQITYYDADQKKIKEVIPVQFGVKQGEYLQFYEAGQLMTRGQYDHGHPVGKWTEYYQFRRRQKQEIQYPKDPYDTITKPYILKEWDEKGNLTYDSEKSDEKRVLSSKF